MNIESTFMARTLRHLIAQGAISADDSVLVVFGGDYDRKVLRHLDFRRFVLSNIDPEQSGNEFVDATNLPYAEGAYDHVIAHAGLHHCSRPHQALCEMYRVARRTAIVFESQDSIPMRLAVRAGIVQAYEWNAIFDSGMTMGGVDNRPIPNYVYRWTRREVEKVLRSLDPARQPSISFIAEWDFSYSRIARRLKTSPLGILPVPALKLFSRIGLSTANKLIGRYGNLFCACIHKESAHLMPWIAREDTGIRFEARSVPAPARPTTP